MVVLKGEIIKLRGCSALFFIPYEHLAVGFGLAGTLVVVALTAAEI